MDEVADLRADCARCSALCCVALPYAASADFAYDKPAGRPCRHLDDFSCSIHAQLPERGFPGCTVFDCLGAGQQVTQHTYDGLTWRDRPDLAGEIFAAFLIMRQLQELRWYLRQADRGDQPGGRPAAGPRTGGADRRPGRTRARRSCCSVTWPATGRRSTTSSAR